jgi:hypothetical protein
VDWFENRKKELANRPLIREQAFGEALDPDKLERLGRYEVHLDRKLGRMLTMLLRLKDLRRGAGHRQTKEAATDMFSLQPPRHIPTLPLNAGVICLDKKWMGDPTLAP